MILLHCENGDNFSGLRSMMSCYQVCIQVALALGRTFFIHQKQYEHFGGIFRRLQSQSSCCGYLKERYRATGSYLNKITYSLRSSSCNLHEPLCYLKNGYEITIYLLITTRLHRRQQTLIFFS